MYVFLPEDLWQAEQAGAVMLANITLLYTDQHEEATRHTQTVNLPVLCQIVVADPGTS